MADSPVTPAAFSIWARRPEDIALDLMKFIALTTGYGKMQAGAGFSGKSAAPGDKEYADSLLELYGRCRQTVEKSSAER